MGSSIAPTIGGLLSKPTVLYPTLFDDRSIFMTYPYLLPCLTCMAWSFITWIWCLFFLTESSNVDRYKAVSNIEDQSLHDGEFDNSYHGDVGAYQDNNDRENNILKLIQSQSFNSDIDKTTIADDTLNSALDDGFININHHSDKNDSNSKRRLYSGVDDVRDMNSFEMIEMRIINNRIEYVKVEESSSITDGSVSSSNAVLNSKTVLRDRNVLLATANYGETS